ncbi:MAG: class I SAM-dependent RNA methyltransferase, partial [Actinomycetota bacterium]
MTLELDLLREAHGGFCVARHDGKVVFVRGGLPGERVRAVVTAEGARFDTARVVEVLTPSPDRVEHVWQAAARQDVGGADLGHVSPAAQLRWKANVIADVMARIGGPEVVGALPDPVEVAPVGESTLGTRTRVSFAVDDAGRLAMRRPRSHDLVPVDSMPLAVPEVAALDLFGGNWRWVPGGRVGAVVPSDSAPVVVTAGGVWEAPGRPGGRRVREVVSHAGDEFRYAVDAGGFWQVHRDAPGELVRRVLGGAALAGG